ncbi:hypothetical protein ACS0TY_028894 [Phlomoides rotata]
MIKLSTSCFKQGLGVWLLLIGGLLIDLLMRKLKQNGDDSWDEWDYSSAIASYTEVLGVSFSPNGYHLAIGGEDNTYRIWDLWKRKSLYIISAHSNLISQVKFEQQEGYFWLLLHMI